MDLKKKQKNKKKQKLKPGQEAWEIEEYPFEEKGSERIKVNFEDYSIRIDDRVTIKLVEGSVCSQKVDCITNTANGYLSHSSGLSLRIRQKGGIQIEMESSKWVEENGPVEVGNVAWTNGGDLQQKYVIHAVGPIYSNTGKEQCFTLMDELIGNILDTASKQLKVESISIPSISTGVQGFPKHKCAEIFYMTTIRWLLKQDESCPLTQIDFCNFDNYTNRIFQKMMHLIFEWEEKVKAEGAVVCLENHG